MTSTRPRLTVLARLRSALPTLGPSEARVAAVMIDRAEDVVSWSTAELAEAAETSAATVIRACQSLGFRGFQHLRLELARSAPLTEVPRPGQPSNTFDDAVDAIRLAQERVDGGLIERLAGNIDRAGRVLLVSNGFSGPPLQDFGMRLSTLGRSNEAPVDPLAQQFAAHTLGDGDLCLALSYSGANVQTLHACQAAADRGAVVAAITSYQRSPIVRMCDLVIATGPSERSHGVDPFLARIGHTVVLHALHSALPERSGGVEEMRDVVADALVDD